MRVLATDASKKKKQSHRRRRYSPPPVLAYRGTRSFRCTTAVAQDGTLRSQVVRTKVRKYMVWYANGWQLPWFQRLPGFRIGPSNSVASEVARMELCGDEKGNLLYFPHSDLQLRKACILRAMQSCLMSQVFF